MAFQFARKVAYVDGTYYHFRVNLASDTNKYTAHEDERQKSIFSVVKGYKRTFDLDQQYEDAVNVAIVHSIRQLGHRKYFHPQNKAPFFQRYQEFNKLINEPPFCDACSNVNRTNLDKWDKLIIFGHRAHIWIVFCLSRMRQFYHLVQKI